MKLVKMLLSLGAVEKLPKKMKKVKVTVLEPEKRYRLVPVSVIKVKKVKPTKVRLIIW